MAKPQQNDIVQPVMQVIRAQERRPPAKASDKAAGDRFVADIRAAKAEMRAAARRFPEPPHRPAS